MYLFNNMHHDLDNIFTQMMFIDLHWEKQLLKCITGYFNEYFFPILLKTKATDKVPTSDVSGGGCVGDEGNLSVMLCSKTAYRSL